MIAKCRKGVIDQPFSPSKSFQRCVLSSSSSCFCPAGDWGYNTADERKEAASFERIHIVKLDEFCAKLK